MKLGALFISAILVWFASMALQMAPASASTIKWDWTISGSGPDNGSGTFTIDSSCVNACPISNPTGTIEGLSITGLGSYMGADNLLDIPIPGGGEPDGSGISFIAGGVSFNVFQDGPYIYLYTSNETSNFVAFGAAPAPPSATPLPAALPLFATGLGAMGLLGWRRKRKNTTAIAAA
jgi:hypothetical protein